MQNITAPRVRIIGRYGHLTVIKRYAMPGVKRHADEHGRKPLAKRLGISPQQLSYVTQSGAGEGLLFYGNTIIPFIDRFPKDTKLYQLMTTKPEEVIQNE